MYTYICICLYTSIYTHTHAHTHTHIYITGIKFWRVFITHSVSHKLNFHRCLCFFECVEEGGGSLDLCVYVCVGSHACVHLPLPPPHTHKHTHTHTNSLSLSLLSYGSPPPCIKISSFTCEDICFLDGCIQTDMEYGVATISRLLKIIGLFCRISSRL